jgi:DNA-directed RNA polymerase specialized sigma24 family protein
MDGSVTRLILDLRNGSDLAAEKLWYCFQHRLKALAGRKLGRRGGIYESDDIAVDAFYSFLQRYRDGKFPSVENRDDVWRMMVVIVIRKAINAIKYASRKCRFAHPSDNTGGALDSGTSANNSLLYSEALAQSGSAVADVAFEELLSTLKDQQLRNIAALKIYGFSNSEIAQEIGCSLATVERRLRVIRTLWESELQE